LAGGVVGLCRPELAAGGVDVAEVLVGLGDQEAGFAGDLAAEGEGLLVVFEGGLEIEAEVEREQAAVVEVLGAAPRVGVDPGELALALRAHSSPRVASWSSRAAILVSRAVASALRVSRAVASARSRASERARRAA
jgi:hypothetical protein